MAHVKFLKEFTAKNPPGAWVPGQKAFIPDAVTPALVDGGFVELLDGEIVDDGDGRKVVQQASVDSPFKANVPGVDMGKDANSATPDIHLVYDSDALRQAEADSEWGGTAPGPAKAEEREEAKAAFVEDENPDVTAEADSKPAAKSTAKAAAKK